MLASVSVGKNHKLHTWHVSGTVLYILSLTGQICDAVDFFSCVQQIHRIGREQQQQQQHWQGVLVIGLAGSISISEHQQQAVSSE